MTTTVGQMQAAMQQRRAEAAKEYRRLLLRNENPLPDDVAKLTDCLKTLGRTEADVPGDLEAALGIQAAQDAAALRELNVGPRKELSLKREKVNETIAREQKELHAKHQAMRAEIDQEQSRLNANDDDGTYAEKMRLRSIHEKRWQAILDGRSGA